MKKIFLILAAHLLAFLLVPFLCARGWTAPLAQYLPSTAAEDSALPVYIPVLVDGAVEELPLTQYLCGVVAAEMPASYPEEALKAQAVAACSYMVYRSVNDPNAEAHKGAWVCNDPSHCKGYLTPAQMKQNWGEDNYARYYAKIAAAVGAVAGRIMTYEGEPVNAVFHAISAGTTEAAADVWGQDVPYLQAVESLVDVNAADYQTAVTCSAQELYRLLAILRPQVEEDLALGAVDRSDSGGVRKAEIGGCTFTGAQLRSTLSLRSTNFEITRDGDTFTFTVRGYGHCVGMSQHGAGQLAQAGMTYTDILQTYYTGVTVEPYSFS